MLPCSLPSNKSWLLRILEQADCDAFGSIDIRHPIFGYCGGIGGEGVWPTHDASLNTGCRTSPSMEHDLVHLRHHLVCRTETRRRSSTSSNPQSAVDTSRDPVDARFPGRYHCPRQHSDLCYDVQPTTRSVEVDIGPTRKGDMQTRRCPGWLCYVQWRLVQRS